MLPAPGVQDLLLRAKDGDREAMNGLLERLRPHLEALARGYADPNRASESTADLVQEAWLRAWQKLDQFAGGASEAETEGMLRAWVGQIVHRLGLNMRRDGQALKRSPGGGVILPLAPPQESSMNQDGGALADSREPTPSANVRQDEEADRIARALEKLGDPKDRAIVQLRFFDGLSLRQIAERLGGGYDSVRERYQKAMRLLERELGDLE